MDECINIDRKLSDLGGKGPRLESGSARRRGKLGSHLGLRRLLGKHPCSLSGSLFYLKGYTHPQILSRGYFRRGNSVF